MNEDIIVPEVRTPRRSPITDPFKVPGSLVLFADAFARYWVHIRAIVLVGLAAAVATWLLHIISATVPLALSIVIQTLSILVVTGITNFYVKYALSPERISFQEAAQGTVGFVALIIRSACAVLGGLALLVIPGIYAVVMISFAPFAWRSEQVKSTEAQALSWYYVEGLWGTVLFRWLALSVFLVILGGAFILTGLIAFAIFGFGPRIPTDGYVAAFVIRAALYILVLPLSVCYAGKMYEALRQMKPELPSPEHGAQLGRVVGWFFALGIITVVTIAIVFVIGVFQ